MKKVLLTVMSVMASITMNAQQTGYNITGTVPGNVEKAYLYNSKREAIDSTTVNNGKFAMSGSLPHNELVILYTGSKGIPCFNDGTPINVNIAGKTLTGSALNVKLYTYEQQLEHYYTAIDAIGKEYMTVAEDKSTAGKEKAETLAKRYSLTSDSLTNAMTDIIKQNRDNLIPAVFISSLYYDLGYNELKDLLSPSAPYYNHPAVARAKQHLAALEKRMPAKCSQT